MVEAPAQGDVGDAAIAPAGEEVRSRTLEPHVAQRGDGARVAEGLEALRQCPDADAGMDCDVGKRYRRARVALDEGLGVPDAARQNGFAARLEADLVAVVVRLAGQEVRDDHVLELRA